MTNRMKECRISKNMTLKEVAYNLNITENYVYMLESGLRTPGFGLARKIASLFGKTVEYIFFNQEYNEVLGDCTKNIQEG